MDTSGPLLSENFLFSTRLHGSDHLSTRQYARIVKAWVTAIGLDPTMYGTHTLRRTKVSLIYRRTKNLRAIQLLLGHTKLDSTVRYLGIGSMMPWKWRSRRKSDHPLRRSMPDRSCPAISGRDRHKLASVPLCGSRSLPGVGTQAYQAHLPSFSMPHLSHFMSHDN